MHLRGWCFDSRRPIRAVEVVFASPPAAASLASFGIPSPDVAAALAPEAAHCRFDDWIDVPRFGVDREVRLQFTLSDGTIVLGGPIRGDAVGGAEPARTVVRAEAGIVPDAGVLRAELKSIESREAAFRASLPNEFLNLGEGNTYLHSLREERSALVRREQEASLDLESFTRKLESALERAAGLEAELEAVRRSSSWRLLAPLRAIAQPPLSGER
jgi:hypothetical protein